MSRVSLWRYVAHASRSVTACFILSFIVSLLLCFLTKVVVVEVAVVVVVVVAEVVVAEGVEWLVCWVVIN